MGFMSPSPAPRPLSIPRPRRRPATTRAALLRRYRKPLALMLLVLGLASFLSSLAPPSSEEQRLVTLSVDRPAGAELRATDLEVRMLPAQLDSPGLLSDPQQVIGQRLAVGLPAGSLVSEQMLIGPQLLTGTTPGTVAVPIRLSDPATVQLLHAGQLVDIVLSSGDGFEREVLSETIGRRLAVLWVPVPGDSSGLGLLGAGTTHSEGMVVVAADESLAGVLSGAVTRGKVSAVLVN